MCDNTKELNGSCKNAEVTLTGESLSKLCMEISMKRFSSGSFIKTLYKLHHVQTLMNNSSISVIVYGLSEKHECDL